MGYGVYKKLKTNAEDKVVLSGKGVARDVSW